MWRKGLAFAHMVKVEHTLFALPFAYAGAFLAAGGLPAPRQLFWITVAMVGARNAAMGLNRLIDRHIDALNPRTMGRHLPAGRIKPLEAWLFTAAFLLLLGVAAWQLNRLCLALLPLAVLALVVYPYAKRFTWTCHYWMVPAQFFAPFGGWIAVTGQVHPAAVVLGLAVGLWIAAFDIIYALQDLGFDRAAGVHSLPASLGVRTALWVARASHALVVVLFLWLRSALHLGPIYLAGVLAVAVLLTYQHLMVSPRDFTRAAIAFNVNLVIGPLLFASIVADLAL